MQSELKNRIATTINSDGSKSGNSIYYLPALEWNQKKKFQKFKHDSFIFRVCASFPAFGCDCECVTVIQTAKCDSSKLKKEKCKTIKKCSKIVRKVNKRMKQDPCHSGRLELTRQLNNSQKCNILLMLTIDSQEPKSYFAWPKVVT